MKKYLILLISLFSVELLSTNLYDSTEVFKIEIIFYDSEYKTILQQNYEEEIDLAAKLIFNDDIIIDSVGVRYKGNSSYNTKGEKKSFNVSIDAFRDEQRLLGYKTLNLNNAFVDPTFMREALTNKIWKNYIPTMKSGYVYLYVNGEEYGLYSNVQQVNKDFLGEWYSSKKGNNYKGEPQGELSWLGENKEQYKTKYEKKTNEEEDDWSDLINLINVINNSQNLENELPKYLNTDRAIWYFALCNAFVNLDSYVFSSHNYYIYNNPATNKFDFIPWDVNESFGTFPPSLPFDKDKFPILDLKAPNRTPLMKNMLAINKFKNIYYSHYKTILNEVFDRNYIETIINEIRPVIEEYVQKDPKKLYTYDNFKTNIYDDVQVENRQVFGLLNFVEKRKTFLSQINELKDNYPTIIKVESKSDKVIAGNDLIINSKISGENISKVILHYRYGESSFEEVTMLDDGNSNDEMKDDMIFGVNISVPKDVEANNIDYYVTAENNIGRITFYPARAEFEFLTAEIIHQSLDKNIVINEFMADNSATIQDPQGKYEDWIELFNLSNEEISLNGWYLTDDAAVPNKWQFPDIKINAGEYLIIWADEDLEDEGVHADIKLSKSGEYIGLYDKDFNKIDSYSFGAQLTNVSEARYPNGTGSFVKTQIPTPGAENKHETSVQENQYGNIVISPNPASDYMEISFDRYAPSTECIASEGCEIKIYNSLSEMVLTVGTGRDLSLQRIDVSHLPIGLYFIQIGNNLHKFLVMR